MIRQSLEDNSPYVDAALHGSGLLSLQYRDVAGGPTTEIETLAPQTGLRLRALNAPPAQMTIPKISVFSKTDSLTVPIRVRLVKRGAYAYLYMALEPGDPLTPSGASIPMPFTGDFYVGIGLSAHDKDATEHAFFENLTAERSSTPPSPASSRRSSTPRSKPSRSIPRSAPSHSFSPKDSKRPIGPATAPPSSSIAKAASGDCPQSRPAHPPPVPELRSRRPNPSPSTPASPRGATTTTASRPTAPCWRSATSRRDAGSRSSTRCRSAAGRPSSSRRGPSYWHGWSPDGKTLAYCGRARRRVRHLHHPPPRAARDPADDRQGARRRPRVLARRQVDLLQLRPDRHDANLADESRRHRAGASHPRRVQQLVPPPLARRPEDGVPLLRERRHRPPREQGRDLADHVPRDRKIDVLGTFFGGQGTINVPCWSPDAKKIAFVSYELLPREEVPPTKSGANQ